MKALLFVLVLTSLCFAQLDANIDEYRIYIDKVDNATPIPAVIITGDTTLTINWNRGTVGTIGFITPYETTFQTMVWVDNIESLWTGGDASNPTSVSLTNGFYEITTTEVDVFNNESGRSNPVYLECQIDFALVPMNLGL